MNFIIRNAHKEWICFNCSKDIIKGESHYECSTSDYNSSRTGKKTKLRLCKDCGNMWEKREQIPTTTNGDKQ